MFLYDHIINFYQEYILRAWFNTYPYNSLLHMYATKISYSSMQYVTRYCLQRYNLLDKTLYHMLTYTHDACVLQTTATVTRLH